MGISSYPEVDGSHGRILSKGVAGTEMLTGLHYAGEGDHGGDGGLDSSGRGEKWWA